MENLHLFIILFLVGIIFGGTVVVQMMASYRTPYPDHSYEMGYHRNNRMQWIWTIVFMLMLFFFFASQKLGTSDLEKTNLPNTEIRMSN